MGRFDEMLAKAMEIKHRRPPSDEEHRIQTACVQWFRLQFKQLRMNLFAVPNGSKRDVIIGAKLKEEGVLAGVSDLILLYPSGEYSALCIEMKTPKGKQSQSQQLWQQHIEAYGYKYVICRSLSEFMEAINNYLNDI